LLLWIDQESNNRTVFWLIWLWRHGVMMVLTNYFVVSKLNQWLTLNVKSHMSTMHFVFHALLGGNYHLVVLINIAWRGSRLPSIVSDAIVVAYLLSFTPNTWICLAILLSHDLFLAIGTTCNLV
jgi:hypothetical protein